MSLELRVRGWHGSAGDSSRDRFSPTPTLPLPITTPTGRRRRLSAVLATLSLPGKIFFIVITYSVILSIWTLSTKPSSLVTLSSETIHDNSNRSIVDVVPLTTSINNKDNVVNEQQPPQSISIETWVPKPQLQSPDELVSKIKTLGFATNTAADSTDIQADKPQVRREFSLDSLPFKQCSSTYETPSPDRHQRCCLGHSGLTCFPNLVIVGAQKAGTTALHSYLLFHPNLLPGKKKELHVFDLDRNFMDVTSRFRAHLPTIPTTPTSWNNTSASRMQITLDSSPSYIADSRACTRMSSTLHPDARFIMLLREPVERLWSDVQMKKRRVDVQDELLLDLVPRFHKQVYDCIQSVFYRMPGRISIGSSSASSSSSRSSSPFRDLPSNPKDFKHCVPPEISKHARFPAFSRYIQVRTPHTVKFVNECLAKSPEAVIECVQSDEFRGKILTEKMPDIPRVIYAEAEHLTRIFANQGCCVSYNLTIDTNSSQPMNVSIKETQDDAAPLNLRQLTQGGGGGVRGGRLGHQECKGCGCSCMPRSPMMSDISKNFIWRSMYHPQLVHCFQTIDRDRFLFLDMRDLRRDAAGTLSKVFKHAGLPDLDVSSITHDQALALFNKFYPEFGTISGWSRGGFVKDEKSIPEDLKRFLRDFFRPFNQQLFEFLGIPPLKGWSV